MTTARNALSPQERANVEAYAQFRKMRARAEFVESVLKELVDSIDAQYSEAGRKRFNMAMAAARRVCSTDAALGAGK